MNIFLADLQNSYFRYLRNSVPIGMGYVYAYLNKVFGNQIRLSQFRKFEDLYDAAKTTQPDVVLFGSYSWNTRLTRRAARYLRETFPDTIIAVGGPDVSPVVLLTEAELRALPDVDFMMPNEGEGPARMLVEAALGARSRHALKRTAVRGCLGIDPDSGARTGDVMSRFEEDINEIPSPYLDGFMDPFLAEKDYLAIIQTARGCPYRCTFCVSGKDTWSKVKMFEIERVKAEIDYVAKRAQNPYLRLADENFGLMRRDPEIADYIIEARKKTGFPSALSIYTDKHPTDRVKYINRTLRDLLPFCISFQSSTPDVLKNIKRVNLKEDEVADAVSFARENRLTLVTELIFPLPGETKETFLKAVDTLMGQRFDSIVVNHMRILKGTEMDLPEDRGAHKIVTKLHMSENGYTTHEALENIEIDESVMGNATISEEDVREINRFIMLFDIGHFRGLFKELLFLFESQGLKATDLLLRCATDRESCPILWEYGNRYVEGIEAMMFDTQEEVVEWVRAQIKKNPSAMFGIAELKNQLATDLLITERYEAAVSEMVAMAIRLLTEKNGTLPNTMTEEIKTIQDLVLYSFIPFSGSVPEELVLTSPFDVLAWARENYARPLSDYRRPAPTRIALRIPNYAIYATVWGSNETLRDRYSKYTKSINSANRRRILTEPTGGGHAALPKLRRSA